MRLTLFLMAAPAMFAACEVRLAPSPDYSFLAAGKPDGLPISSIRWMRNGLPWREQHPPQTFLLRASAGAASAEGAEPLAQRGVAYTEGKWGSALYLAAGGQLAFARNPYLPLAEGTIEMWIAAREDGSSPTFTKDVELFRYTGTNGEYLRIAQAARDGTLYLGGIARGEWQSAYGGRASMRSWKAGEWHHIAATYSESGNFMRFYLDGVKTADTNERHYWPPAATGDRFTLAAGSLLIDEIRISSRPLEEQEIRWSASRMEPPLHGEVWIPLADASPGDSLQVESGGCTSAAFAYRGLPISEVDPPSTLLPPGTTSLTLRIQTADATSCRYAIGAAADFGTMRIFDETADSREHRTWLSGLSADPDTVNEVYVRCASAPDYARKLLYRALGTVNPAFPRIGNLWGSSGKLSRGHEHAARVKGYFGAEMAPADIRRLRELNPAIIILSSINTVENRGLPEEYYLHDTRGNRIEVWPGTYRLNLTKPLVAEYQAGFAYQKMLDSGMLYDGLFFDNFFTTQSWLRADIHGTPVQLDADEDGRPDDPKWLDEEWRKGVFHELAMWRKLMPHALATGHLPRPVPPEVGEIFNGSGILFISTNVLDGTASFSNLWDSYHRWWQLGRQPVITAIEASPANQLAYGYGYNIARDMPLPTQEFGRTQYRHMRFALGLALMNDGYFWHDYGDTWHGTDWWYDEYDFDLGYPLGPAQLFETDVASGVNMLGNGGFEEPLAGTWQLTVSGQAGAAATVTRDTDAAEGQFSALIAIGNAGAGVDWHVDFNQRDRALVKDTPYELTFCAKADASRDISLRSQKGAPDWRNYGLARTVTLTANWQRFSVTFEANETAQDSRIQFFLGARAGKVWIDGVRLGEQPNQVYWRRFTRGAVVLNGSRKRMSLAFPEGYSRFSSSEAPKYQYTLDDADAGFRAAGPWREVVLDTGQWKSRGPYYHTWGKSCRKLEGGEGEAAWDLGIREDGTYTIEAWWAAAPEQYTWTRNAVYEVVAAGNIVARASLDQTAPGDQWRKIAEVTLRAEEKPFVRIRNAGGGALIADGLCVYSAARYNDGTPAWEVALDALDAILLRLDNPQQ